ncbi:hypothetical protein WJX81_006330 [Elliptochloris bilobata]|uniref:Aminotransferase class I/classII large domain-containing protein n=1 Tax=Elliptochloris bilobata TaxID=381761 RepID=A0AAW1R169_9CHLO
MLDCHVLLSQPWENWLTDSLSQLRSANLLRTLRPVVPTLNAVEVVVPGEVLWPWLAEGGVVPAVSASAPDATGGGVLKLFSLNDYLGLSTHPAVCQAAAHAALLYGSGPRSSALVGGHTHAHRELECALAALKGAQDALLFPTGFAANLAAVSALACDAGAVVFSDELNHASIIDGARLAGRAGAAVHVYRHNDLAHLERLLVACPPGRRRLVVTDSLFSMDGDFADLQGLAELRQKHGFLLAIDEAHATLVCGERGGGAAESAGVADQVDLHIGTLSKAAGAHGGFVACRADMRSLLVTRGRAGVFSTALPAPVVAAATAALRVAAEEPWRRQHLWRLVERLGAGLGVRAASPIVPLVIGGEAAALAASAALLARGFHVPAIRPPTVAAGTSRLRISLSAAHTCADAVQNLTPFLTTQLA